MPLPASLPKVELHVHLEGAIRPETVLKLAHANEVVLPATTVEGLRDWYTFRDFNHFVEVYVSVTRCIKTPGDLELVVREFFEGQAAQDIFHTEVTYTASTLARICGIAWADQIPALEAGLSYARGKLGLSGGFVLDIVREDTEEGAGEVAQWAIEGRDRGIVCALGLAGREGRAPAAKFQDALRLAADAGLPFVPHAGETVGPESVWEILEFGPRRIGHGVRSVEDPGLVRRLREEAIPIEVCPSSNVCLGVYPSLAEHPLARLMDDGVVVTVNSDDPPMFGTSLSEEYRRCSEAFGFDQDIWWSLTLNAANAAILEDGERRALIERLRAAWPADES